MRSIPEWSAAASYHSPQTSAGIEEVYLYNRDSIMAYIDSAGTGVYGEITNSSSAAVALESAPRSSTRRSTLPNAGGLSKLRFPPLPQPGPSTLALPPVPNALNPWVRTSVCSPGLLGRYEQYAGAGDLEVGEFSRPTLASIPLLCEDRALDL